MVVRFAIGMTVDESVGSCAEAGLVPQKGVDICSSSYQAMR